MRIKYFVCLVLICLACSSKNPITISSTLSNIDMGKFKYHNLKVFDASTLYKRKIIDNLVKIDSLEIVNIFGVKDLPYSDAYYYYSTQKSIGDYKVLTFVHEYELCCREILYNVYKNGVLLYSFQISNYSYDVPANSNSITKYINDTSLLYYEVSRRLQRETPEYSINSVDSVVKKYKILDNYELKQTFEKKFKYSLKEYFPADSIE